MSAKHSGRSGTRGWPTCPVRIPAHLRSLRSATSRTPVVGHEGWNHLDLREETQLGQPGVVLGRPPAGRWGIRRTYLHGIQGRLWQERKAQRKG